MQNAQPERTYLIHDPVTREAWDLLEAAKRRVTVADIDAQKEAKLRDEGIIGGPR